MFHSNRGLLNEYMYVRVGTYAVYETPPIMIYTWHQIYMYIHTPIGADLASTGSHYLHGKYIVLNLSRHTLSFRNQLQLQTWQ